MQERSESDDRDDEEEEMLAAAALWAKGKNDPNDEEGHSLKSSHAGHDERRDGKRGRDGEAERLAKSVQKEKNNSSNKADKMEDQANDGWLTPSAPVVYSLHITQLPYEATVAAVRGAFVRKGCTVTSIRFVYARDEKTGTRTFRGVAFIDVADEASFNLALELDKTILQGHSRKMNVRPTKTKAELASIVQRTKERLAAKKIDVDKSKKNDKNKRRHFSRMSAGRAVKGASASEKPHEKADGSQPKKKRRMDNRKSPDKSKAVAAATERDNASQTKDKASSGGKKAPHSKGHKKQKDAKPEKLTKKERAKKAAIIRARAGKK